MDDYIKREDAKEYLHKFASEEFEKRDMKFAGRLTAMQVEKIPSADVAPVRHGRWTYERLPSTSGGSYEVIRCSECQLQVPIYETMYCPNCGARMDGENDE